MESSTPANGLPWTSTPALPIPGGAGSGTTTPPEACDRQPDPAALLVCDGSGAAFTNGTLFDTVQTAIDAAIAGGTVWVCPGTWPTSASSFGKSVDLRAVDPAQGVTVLTGQGVNRVLDLSDGTFRIDGIEIREGYSSYAGGGVRLDDTTTTLSCSRVLLNVADSTGGGIDVNAGSLALVQSELYDNYADYEGGAVHAASAFSGAVVTCEDTKFLTNEAGYGGGAVAAASTIAPSITMERCTFERNTALHEGGALSVGGGPGTLLTLIECGFTENFADHSGGAVDIGGTDIDLVAADTSFVGNSSAVAAGGAVNLDVVLDAVVTFTNVEFSGNHNAYYGAAVAVESVGGAVLLDGVVLHSNAGTSAAWDHDSGATLECVGCDLGSGTTDNSPADIVAFGQTVNGGASASFVLP